MQVKWEIQGEYLQVELIGRMPEDNYMSFGLSGASGRPQMVKGNTHFNLLYNHLTI